VSEFFEMRDGQTAPTCCWWPRGAGKRCPDDGTPGLDKLKVIRSVVRRSPTSTFGPGPDRDAERHGRLYRLMKRSRPALDAVMINTSFNVRGERCLLAEHAYHCSWHRHGRAGAGTTSC